MSMTTTTTTTMMMTSSITTGGTTVTYRFGSIPTMMGVNCDDDDDGDPYFL